MPPPLFCSHWIMSAQESKSERSVEPLAALRRSGVVYCRICLYFLSRRRRSAPPRAPHSRRACGPAGRPVAGRRAGRSRELLNSSPIVYT
jgi:hypothetical protein